MTRRKRILLQAAALLAIVGAVAFVRLRTAGEAAEDTGAIPKPVKTATPVRMDLEETVEAWGHLRSSNQVTLLPKVSGTVTSIHGAVGDTVARGDLLAEIDSEAYLFDYQRAEAAREASASTWERLDRLYGAGNVTRQDWENAKAAHTGAESQAAAAKLRHDWTRVFSPADGVILMKHIALGALVAPEAGTPLFTIGSLETLELELDVPEEYYPSFSRNEVPAVRISSDSFPDTELKGNVISVAPWINPATRTFQVICEVNSEAEWLRPGMFLTAVFILDLRNGAPVLPADAMAGDGGFWVVDSSGTASYRHLESSFISGNYVAVPEAWADETFVVEGQHFIADGDKVNIIGGELSQ